MKTSNLFTFLIIITVSVSLIGCGNTQNKDVESTKIDKSGLFSDTKMDNKNPDLSNLMKQAKTSKKAIFLVVRDQSDEKALQALNVAKKAKLLYNNVDILEMDRDAEMNSSYVEEWGLSGAPLPVILVFSPKGVLSGGRVLGEASPEAIVSLIPSPKMEEVYQAIERHIPAMVVFSSKIFKDRELVIDKCKKASAILKGNSEIILVDINDQKEDNFLSQLGISKPKSESLTLVINAQGQVSGTSETVPDPVKLASAATQVVREGCGPGCGPSGCGK